jgi:hypothetical protein
MMMREGSLTSLVSLNTTAGQTYQIAVDGWSSNTGQIALNFVVPPPPNDNFANQIPLTGEQPPLQAQIGEPPEK